MAQETIVQICDFAPAGEAGVAPAGYAGVNPILYRVGDDSHAVERYCPRSAPTWLVMAPSSRDF